MRRCSPPLLGHGRLVRTTLIALVVLIPHARTCAGLGLRASHYGIGTCGRTVSSRLPHSVWLAGGARGRQTVNRGELGGGVAVLAQVAPVAGMWTTLVTDSGYVVRGASLPREALLLGINGDTSMDWHEQVDRHGYRVRVVKVTAHLNLQDVRDGGLALR